MTQTKGALRWAANFVALSAGLHILSLMISSFSAEAIGMLPFGIVYAGLAYGLYSGWRWLAYVAFIAMFIGAILAISNIWSIGDVPGWLYAAIASVNLLAAAATFGGLWKSP